MVYSPNLDAKELKLDRMCFVGAHACGDLYGARQSQNIQKFIAGV